MKSLVVQLAFVMGLLVVHGCGNSPKQASQNPVENNSSTATKHNHDVGVKANNSSSSNQKSSPSSPTTAKLTSPPKISSTQGVPLEIKVQDQAGQPIDKFETPQQKPMHLIVVSDDLRFFNHIHPNYQGKGKFAINHDFPAPGNYTLFSDYKPNGQAEQIAVEKVSIPGNVPIPSELETFANTQTVENTKVQFQLSQAKPQAGKEVKFSFNLIDTAKKQPVTDLQAYLGKQAHLVIIRSSSPLTAADYIHAHSLNTSNKGKVEFKSKFPHQGTYKIWLQFQRNGKVATAPFWVTVN